MKLTREELDGRRLRFVAAMNEAFPLWDTALIVSNVNQYYFTGTMQNALLLIKSDGSYGCYVRKSWRRACDESPLEAIFPIKTYRDAADHAGKALGNTYIEAEVMPVAMLERIKSAFSVVSVGALDTALARVRGVKTDYELYWMEKCGQAHDDFIMHTVPALFHEGISEAQLVGAMQHEMSKIGYQGITRFSHFGTEIVVGQVGFGENSLYPTSFDGPGGSRGHGACAPVGGDPGRFLKKGDLVFVDFGFGMKGYHTDRTQVFVWGAEPTDEMVRIHTACIDVQNRTAAALVPGAIPSKVYGDIMQSLDGDFREGFMGYGEHCVKFLGHGVGLQIDEWPVIARGFDEPLQENMVIALEPKKGLKGVGMLGVEDTYVVTPSGARCLTGGGQAIVKV